MRQKLNPQWNLFTTMARNQIAKELEMLSQVLDPTPKAVELVYRDSVRSTSTTRGGRG